MIEGKRTPGWRARLSQVLLADPSKPHAWGPNDCFSGLVVPAVHALIGQDIGAEWQGKYDSPEGVQELLVAHGFDDIADYMASLFPEVHPSALHIGDVAAVEGVGGLICLGVTAGERVMVLGEGGLGSVKLTRATRGFRVG